MEARDWFLLLRYYKIICEKQSFTLKLDYESHTEVVYFLC